MEHFSAEQFEIINSHTHIYPEKISQKAADTIGEFYDIPMYGNGSANGLLEDGAKIGTAMYLVCSAATSPQQVESINNFIKREADEHEEFFPFGTLHPDMDDISSEVDRMISLGFHGIKLHPDFQKFDIDSVAAFKMYDVVRGRLPILFHMGDDRYIYSRPNKLKKVLDNFTELRAIAAHFGGYRCWDEARDVLGRNPNVRFDTSSSLPMLSRENARELVSYYGTENMFFGTDFPMWSSDKELERFFALGLSFEENRKILSQNFRDFFNI